jgi:hypothetical protein
LIKLSKIGKRDNFVRKGLVGLLILPALSVISAVGDDWEAGTSIESKTELWVSCGRVNQRAKAEGKSARMEAFR